MSMATGLVIGTDGTVRSVDVDPNSARSIAGELEAETIDLIRCGCVDVYVDDCGAIDERPVNAAATALVARFGYTDPVAGPALLLGYSGGAANTGLDQARLRELAGYGIVPG